MWLIVLKRIWPYLLGAAVLWFAYDWAYDRGYDAAQAKCVGAADTANKNNEAAAAQAGDELDKSLETKLPDVQRNAYESVERIHTVYVDRPVPAECAWTGGVLNELEAGRQAANRAVRGGAGSADSADPEKP